MKGEKLNKEFYGVLAHSTVNIGDEIQGIASMKFLPRIDEFVYRETIDRFIPKNHAKTKLIMNAWWMHQPQNFPTSKYVDPLLISMHFSPDIRDKFLTKQVRDYLVNNGPVGCRDLSTYKWLQKQNIPSYFSGCLTLTLQRNYEIPREDYILCVDTNPKLVEAIKERTSRPVYEISRVIQPCYTTQQRFELAKIILRLYHNAHLVISSRLHVILPSLAMETPVLRIISDESEQGDFDRYEGYETFFDSYTNDELINNSRVYDFDTPVPNRNNHLQMRDTLIKTCQDFTGYNNTESLIIKNCNPTIQLIEFNKYNRKLIKRSAYWLSLNEIKQIHKDKLNGYSRYDLANCKIIERYNKIYLRLKACRYKLLFKLCVGRKKEHYKKKLNKIKDTISCGKM